MAGQSSQLSLKESKAMQERVQCAGSHAYTNGGGKGVTSNVESHRKMSSKKMKMGKM